MSNKTKEQIKAAFIAACVGAAMTFLSTIMQSLQGIDFGMADNVAAGGGSALAYLKAAMRMHT